MAARYKLLHKPEHPNAKANGQVYEHVFVMSEMLGRALIKGEVVHHEDEDTYNNLPSNLKVFPSHSAHMRYHAEQRALLESGDSSFMKCAHCGEYDDPSNMYVRPKQYQAWHRECSMLYKRKDNPQTGPYKFKKEI